MGQANIFASVIDALNRSSGRYVIVGGFAVNLHGYQRFTSDIDVAIDLSPRASARIVQSLFDVGFRPRVPITPEDFGAPEKREFWIKEKGAKVISLIHPDYPTFAVDIFVDPPFDFEQLYASSKVVPIGAISVRIASIEELIKMKKLADRDQDKLDIKVLEKIIALGKPGS